LNKGFSPVGLNLLGLEEGKKHNLWVEKLLNLQEYILVYAVRYSCSSLALTTSNSSTMWMRCENSRFCSQIEIWLAN